MHNKCFHTLSPSEFTSLLLNLSVNEQYYFSFYTKFFQSLPNGMQIPLFWKKQTQNLKGFCVDTSRSLSTKPTFKRPLKLFHMKKHLT